MVVEKASINKQLRRWQTGHVWLVWRFRNFVRQQDQASDAGQRKHFFNKASHISSKLSGHEAYGEDHLKLTPDQIKQFTITVREKVKRGKTPQEILKELEDQERADNNKSPPSSSRPHRLEA